MSHKKRGGGVRQYLPEKSDIRNSNCYISSTARCPFVDE